ncbi:putative glycolipid-binding domain-containing protein [Ramlibacter sp.]|uniref:putative glycolipid-binding domain-containing protein n=1 Tax=Ramlibacter sp. TaxID=1917967 RepID=UPI00178DA2F5|nr:putative glycolipid-binding domain-containing protein [Ramlibacter sp.]MBA2672145.1 putative glycolipid-binding domain-containing protein [Ramlibacter sp.]
MTQQLIAWEWLERPGLDVANVERDEQGVRVQGRVVAEWEGVPLDLAYTLHCEPQWQFQQVELKLAHGAVRRELRLRKHSEGWEVDGAARPDLAEALDIDIMGTPLTNTLPIQRLSWTPGQSRDFVMAYIRLPDLQVQPVRQRYTAGASDDPKLRTFRYQMLAGSSAQGQGQEAASTERYHSAGSGFSAELLVGSDGLVLRYPPYWRRAGLTA